MTGKEQQLADAMSKIINDANVEQTTITPIYILNSLKYRHGINTTLRTVCKVLKLMRMQNEKAARLQNDCGLMEKKGLTW